jgi:hypothetical protein
MKAADFNLSKELNFNFDSGITSFRDTRLLLLDSNAMGLLRQDIIGILGIAKTRDLFIRFGYQQGYADFMQIKLGYEFDNELELLSVGPLLYTWEGVVKAVADEVRYNRSTGDFYLSATCINSYEAEQHLTFNGYFSDPACWSMMGYASGWCSGFFGSKVIAIEQSCIGKGDACCYVHVKSVAAWDSEVVKPYLNALSDF